MSFIYTQSVASNTFFASTQEAANNDAITFANSQLSCPYSNSRIDLYCADDVTYFSVPKGTFFAPSKEQADELAIAFAYNHLVCGDSFTSSLNPPVVSSSIITTESLTPFTYTIIASNSPISYNATNLPAGLTLNTSTGVISGQLGIQHTYSVIISATNDKGTGIGLLTIQNLQGTIPVAGQYLIEMTPGDITQTSNITNAYEDFPGDDGEIGFASAGNNPSTATSITGTTPSPSAYEFDCSADGRFTVFLPSSGNANASVDNQTLTVRNVGIVPITVSGSVSYSLNISEGNPISERTATVTAAASMQQNGSEVVDFNDTIPTDTGITQLQGNAQSFLIVLHPNDFLFFQFSCGVQFAGSDQANTFEEFGVGASAGTSFIIY